MSGYKRPFLVRFIVRNSNRIKSVCQFTASVAAALIFGWMIAAPLLTLGGSDESGPVAGAAMSQHSSPYQHEYRHDAPRPRIVASGAGLGAVGEGL